jgi:hypothetical protein
MARKRPMDTNFKLANEEIASTNLKALKIRKGIS